MFSAIIWYIETCQEAAAEKQIVAYLLVTGDRRSAQSRAGKTAPWAWACWVTLGAQQAGPRHKDPERGGSFLTACRSLIYPAYWTGYLVLRLPWSLISKECTCQFKRHGSIPGPGRSLGEGHSNSLWYSSLENPMDRGAWWATYSSWGPQRVIT